MKKLLDKPFRLMAIIGCVYILIMLFLNFFTGFSYEQSIMPFSILISYVASGIALVMFILTLILHRNHLFYYIGLEVLVFSNLYTGRIYTALFVSSILLVIFLFENILSSRLRVIIYLAIEIIKLALVIPYGAKSFFEYTGITLFSVCTIGCLNLLFRHAYDKKESGAVSLDDYKLSDRQKDCIKEIVLNNTTIKALAINHNVSESAIKKDLAHIYSVLGITGKADLKALFIGYKF